MLAGAEQWRWCCQPTAFCSSDFAVLTFTAEDTADSPAARPAAAAVGEQAAKAGLRLYRHRALCPRIEVDEGGVSHIITAVDAEADQSALLADLPQELLAKLVLPLGEFSKADAAGSPLPKRNNLLQK